MAGWENDYVGKIAGWEGCLGRKDGYIGWMAG
jgi:hypothetical protein